HERANRPSAQPQGLLQRQAAAQGGRLAAVMDAVHRRRGGSEPGGQPRPMRRALAGLLAALCLGAATPASSLAAHSLRIGIADDTVLLRQPPAEAAATVA